MQIFKVGDGVHLTRGSDILAYTVVKVTPKTITIQRDHATLLNGSTSGQPDALKVVPGGFRAHIEGVQRYDIKPDLNGATHRCHWSEKLQAFRVYDQRVSWGRIEYTDFNF